MKALALLALLPLLVQAAPPQTVYRCGPDGRVYSQTPCADGKALSVDDPRSASQQKAAREVTARDAEQAGVATSHPSFDLDALERLPRHAGPPWFRAWCLQADTALLEAVERVAGRADRAPGGRSGRKRSLTPLGRRHSVRPTDRSRARSGLSEDRPCRRRPLEAKLRPPPPP